MNDQRLVVDASAAFNLVTMASDWAARDRYDLIAPELMFSETLSALSQAAYRGDIPRSALATALARLDALGVTAVPTDDRHRRTTLEIAQSLGWAKTYDAEYVALARTSQCPLFTTDERLRRGAQQLVEVITPLEAT